MSLSGAILKPRRVPYGVLLSKPYPIVEDEFTLRASEANIVYSYTFESPIDFLQGASTQVSEFTFPTVISYSSYEFPLEDTLQGATTSVVGMTLPATIIYVTHEQYLEDMLKGTTTSVTDMQFPVVISYSSYEQPLEDLLSGTTTSVTTMTLI